MFAGPLPESRADRVRVMGDCISRWFPPLLHPAGIDPAELDEAEGRLEVRLPATLREWHQRWGRYRIAWMLLYELLHPSQLAVERGALAFCREMCTGQRWGIRLDELAGDDPPVVTWFPEPNFERACQRLSSFALHFVAFNVHGTGSPFPRANGQATDEACRAIERVYPRLPLEQLGLPTSETRFYGHEDLLVQNDSDTWLWVTARTREAFEAVEHLVVNAGIEWEERKLPGDTVG